MFKKVFEDIKKGLKAYLLLFLLGIASRIPFIEKFQTHWDGPDWSIALINYSFANKTPTEPGYPLYIFIGKVFNLFIADLHLSIVAVSVLFAGIGAIIAYTIGKGMFDKRTGIIASVLFLSAPTTFYFGITANPYGLLFTTTSLIAYSVYKIYIKKNQSGVALALFLSLGVGVRPQDFIFFTPLALLGFLYLRNTEKMRVILIFTVASLFWFVPTALAVGGFKNYFGYVVPFFLSGPGINMSLLRLLDILPIIAKGFYLTFTVAALALLYYIKPTVGFTKSFGDSLKSSKKILIFFALWIVPSLVFNLFIRSDHAAHQMAYLTGFLYLIAFAISKVANSKSKLLFILLLITIFNLVTFFRIRDNQMAMPYVSQSYHYSEIVKNNIRMEGIVEYVNSANPQKILIITDSEIFRPITYHLPRYRVYAFSALDSNADLGYTHFGYKWLYKGARSDSIFRIPEEVESIIVVPNNREFFIGGASYEKIELHGNALVYEVDVDDREHVNISLHSLRFE